MSKVIEFEEALGLLRAYGYTVEGNEAGGFYLTPKFNVYMTDLEFADFLRDEL